MSILTSFLCCSGIRAVACGTSAHVISQVAALMEYRELKNLAPNVFPKDVIARTDALWEEIGSIGAYSHSQGVPLIRKHVAEFIQGQCFPSPLFVALY